MRFLIDEMFSPDVAEQLRDAGHDAMHVSELGMHAATDGDLLTLATAQARIVVTENASDFLPLLDARIAAGMEVTPVVIALKRNLPRGSRPTNRVLATGLDRWAQDVTDPYHHVHWLP